MSAYAATGTLGRLALRRDRAMIAAWVAGLTAVVLATGSSFGSLYDTPQKRADLAASMNGNASLRAFYGPMFGWDGTGALTAWRFTVLGAALTGLMAAFVVVRHTRDDEESGRQELVSAGAVGRRAPLTAALGTAVGAGLAVGLCVALGSAANGGSVAGAALFGLDLAAGAAVFAGVAAVAAQVAETGRGARGIAGAVLAAAYLLRAAGDAATDDASSPLVWVSPLGWIENTRPYAGDRWWVLLLPFAFAAVCATAAYALAARRDVGAGLVAGRPGPAAAVPSLAGPFALAWRLHRGALAAWAGGFAVAGIVYGAVAGSVADLVKDNQGVVDVIERMGGQAGITDAFLASAMALMGILAAVYAVQCVLRMRGEETSGRAEPVLAGAVGRLRWAGSHLVFAVAGPVLLLAVGGLATGLAHGARIGGLVGAAVAQTPAVWAVAAAAAAVFGLWPRAMAAVWVLVALCVLLGMVGDALQLPQPVMDLSPFTHLPKLPGGDVELLPYALLTAVAALLGAAALAGTRRRDLGG